MDHPVLIRQQARNQQARAILKELGWMERWGAYGQPVLVGATAYGLNVALDLDLEVYCPGDPSIEAGFEVLRACAAHPWVKKASFSNLLDTPDQGYYWQLRLEPEPGQIWKVDTWSVRHDHPGPTARDMLEPMRRSLTDETRIAILMIKEALLAQSEVLAPSIAIYQAVLEGGARTWAEFVHWRAAHPENGLTFWRPSPPGEPRD